MASGFIERVKAFITKPGKAFEAEHKTSVKEAILYSLKGSLILAILFGTIFGLISPIGNFGLLTIPVMIVATFLLNFFGLLLGALWCHLWAYIFGARQGVRNTLKALAFSSTPTYILGWIPIVKYITGLWSLVLFGIGLKKLQKLSTGRAIGVIVVSTIIPLIIVTIITLWAIANYGSLILGNETTSAFSVPY